MARLICLRLLTHCARRAASRAACTAGRSRAIRTAMMAMTTSNSISVKPRRSRAGEELTMGELSGSKYRGGGLAILGASLSGRGMIEEDHPEVRKTKELEGDRLRPEESSGAHSGRPVD